LGFRSPGELPPLLRSVVLPPFGLCLWAYWRFPVVSPGASKAQRKGPGETAVCRSWLALPDCMAQPILIEGRPCLAPHCCSMETRRKPLALLQSRSCGARLAPSRVRKFIAYAATMGLPLLSTGRCRQPQRNCEPPETVDAQTPANWALLQIPAQSRKCRGGPTGRPTVLRRINRTIYLAALLRANCVSTHTHTHTEEFTRFQALSGRGTRRRRTGICRQGL